MKKILLFLILLIPIFNVSALTLCDNTELPNFPLDIYDYNIIVKRTNGYYRLYSFSSDNIVVTLSSSNSFVVNTNSNSYYVYNYDNTPNGSWAFLSSGSSNVSLTIDSVIATDVDILSSSDNSVVLYDNGYNFVCSEPTPVTPQDFSIINYIANIYNDLITSLQSNNISIHTIFISLLIINFLIFVLCYFITHIE